MSTAPAPQRGATAPRAGDPIDADLADSGAMARILAGMFVVGCVTGLIGASSADPSAPAASWIASGAAGVLGVAFWVARDRLEPNVVRVGIFLSSAMVSAALIFDADDSARILYVLPLVLIGAFGNWRSYAGLVALTGVGYAIALLTTKPSDPIDPGVGIWINTVGVSAVAGAVVRLVKRRLDVHLRAVVVLARALDLRDSGTAAHSETVGRFSALTAERLGLSPWRVRQVRLAGVLHDIGKIGVSDQVLNKPGPLSPAEWEQMRRHPEYGAEMLRSAGLPKIAEWIGFHHERPDGAGYPNGLAADEIPLEARIIAVADTYEAMIAERCYSAGMSESAAQSELERVANTQLDADVVAALLAGLPVAQIKPPAERSPAAPA